MTEKETGDVPSQTIGEQAGAILVTGIQKMNTRYVDHICLKEQLGRIELFLFVSPPPHVGETAKEYARRTYPENSTLFRIASDVKGKFPSVDITVLSITALVEPLYVEEFAGSKLVASSGDLWPIFR